MKHIINLTKNPEDVMLSIVELYSENLPLYRGMENYTVKYDFSEGVANIDISVLPQFYRFSISAENSILVKEKPSIPTFVADISMGANGKIKYNSMPYEKDARNWLNKEFLDRSKGVVTRGQYLMTIATVCQIIWSQFLFAFEKHPHNDAIEYVPCKDFGKIAKEGIKHAIAEKRNLYRFDGWDVINLTHKQLKKIGEVLESHQIAHDFDNISLHKFCLSLYSEEQKCFQYYFINHQGNVLHFEIEDTRTEGYIAHCDIKYKKRPDGKLAMELCDNTNAMEWLTQTGKGEGMETVTNWQWMVDLFFSINSFILNFGDVTMEVETKEAIAPSEPREYKRRERNSVRLFKSYKLVKNWTTKARKKAEITCLAWGVRGHFRHYRNGKTIFVESYIKGKEKDKYKGKEYNLLPYKDA